MCSWMIKHHTFLISKKEMSQFDIFVEITNFINYKAFQYDKYGLEFPVFIPSMICRIV